MTPVLPYASNAATAAVYCVPFVRPVMVPLLLVRPPITEHTPPFALTELPSAVPLTEHVMPETSIVGEPLHEFTTGPTVVQPASYGTKIGLPASSRTGLPASSRSWVDASAHVVVLAS